MEDLVRIIGGVHDVIWESIWVTVALRIWLPQLDALVDDVIRILRKNR